MQLNFRSLQLVYQTSALARQEHFACGYPSLWKIKKQQQLHQQTAKLGSSESSMISACWRLLAFLKWVTFQVTKEAPKWLFQALENCRWKKKKVIGDSHLYLVFHVGFVFIFLTNLWRKEKQSEKRLAGVRKAKQENTKIMTDRD